MTIVDFFFRLVFVDFEFFDFPKKTIGPEASEKLLGSSEGVRDGIWGCLGGVREASWGVLGVSGGSGGRLGGSGRAS